MRLQVKYDNWWDTSTQTMEYLDYFLEPDNEGGIENNISTLRSSMGSLLGLLVERKVLTLEEGVQLANKGSYSYPNLTLVEE